MYMLLYCKFFRHHLQSFFYVYGNNRIFLVLLNFPLGGIFVFAMVVIHSCQFHIVYDFPLTLNPCCHGFSKSQILREKLFFNEKVVLRYLNTSLCCKIIITFKVENRYIVIISRKFYDKTCTVYLFVIRTAGLIYKLLIVKLWLEFLWKSLEGALL